MPNIDVIIARPRPLLAVAPLPWTLFFLASPLPLPAFHPSHTPTQYQDFTSLSTHLRRPDGALACPSLPNNPAARPRLKLKASRLRAAIWSVTAHMHYLERVSYLVVRHTPPTSRFHRENGTRRREGHDSCERTPQVSPRRRRLSLIVSSCPFIPSFPLQPCILHGNTLGLMQRPEPRETLSSSLSFCGIPTAKRSRKHPTSARYQRGTPQQGRKPT